MRPVAPRLFALAVLVIAPMPVLSQSVVELRQYTLHPGQRDVLIDLFEREFIEGQEAAGMAVLGQFRDLDRPDRFVWVRAFADMPSRARSLQAFYDGPVWQRHRAAANATMVDSENVLLLRPARATSGFELAGRSRPPPGATASSSALVVATLYSFDEPTETRFVELFEERIRPAFEAAGGRVIAYFVTESAANNFPRLPVREGEHVFVWFASFASEADYAAHLVRRDAMEEWRRVRDELSRWVKGAAEVLRLSPTPISLIGAELSATLPDGARDFDFLIGDWSVRHRRLEHRLADDTNWIEFQGPASVRRILGGLGNVDEIAINLPSGPYVGATLRLFDSSTGLWSIHWMDSRHPGLDPPVIGRFDGNRGVFYGDDTFEGLPVRVRFIWTVVSSATCRWEQAFSADGERSWETNWTMEFRADPRRHSS